MAKPPGHEAVEHRTAPVRWLDADEHEAWLSLARVMARVPPLLDSQLERSAGLNFFGYTILAILSEQEDRTLRMSRLATLTDSSVTAAGQLHLALNRGSANVGAKAVLLDNLSMAPAGP